MKIKFYFSIIALIILFYTPMKSDVCCSQFNGTVIQTEDCCLLFNLFNPACPDLYIQFKQFSLQTQTYIADGNPVPIPMGGYITYKLCLLENQNAINWRIELLDEFGNPRCFGNWTPSTIITGSVGMENCCDCPSESSSWLTLEVDDDSPECPDGCKVTPVLNIPPEITCFKYFSMATDYGNFGQVKPLTDLQNEYYCIEKDQSITVSLALIKNATTDPNNQIDDICYLEKTSEPCEEKPPAPCVPDCPFDEFEKRTPLTIVLTNCPGCTVKVQYATRIACGKFQDIQVLAIDYLSNQCQQTCDIDKIYKNVIGALIAINQMNFEPFDYPDCDTTWRIANGACWGKEILYFISDGVTYREICRYHPCEYSGCCLQQLQVCKLENQGVVITPISQILGIPCPPGLTVIDDKGIIYPCNPACHWAGEVNGEFGQPITLYTSGKQGTVEVDKKENLLFSFESSNDNSMLILNIKSSTKLNMAFTMYNITGQPLFQNNISLTQGVQEIKIDLENLSSGTYFYSFKVNEHEFNANKLVIIK